MQSQVGQIKQFLLAVYTRRRLFVTVAASIALVAVVATFFKVKVYEAKSTVFIEKNVINNLMRGITISPSMNDRIRVLRYHMLSRDMVTRTLKEMDMDADMRFNEPGNFESLVKKCQNNTQISVRGNDLFFVSIVDREPEFAKNYINTLVNIYVEENLAEKRQESYGANRFLTEQVDFYKKKLDEIDDKILDFRRDTGIYSTVTESSVMTQIDQDEEKLKQLKGQKKEIYATIKTIKQQLDMLRETMTTGFNSAYDFADTGNTSDYRIQHLQAKIDELLLVYNDQYPGVVKLREQIEELEKRNLENKPDTSIVIEESESYDPTDDPIYVDLQMRMNMAQSDLNALSAKEQELIDGIKANQALLRDFPEDKRTLNDLERERAMQARIYGQLLQRVGVSEVSKQMEVADKATTFRIVDPAILPTKPVGVKRIALMFMGLLAGLGAGIGVVYLVEYLDDSIKSSDKLRELGVTVLAEIPYIWSDAENQRIRKKDKAAFAYAGLCSVLIGLFLFHDLLGMSFIDHILGNLNIGSFS